MCLLQKQHLSEARLQHTLLSHTLKRSLSRVLSSGHTHKRSGPLTADAVRGCHCGLTGYLHRGRRLSTAGTISKESLADPGSVEGVNQLGKQYEGHRAERPARVVECSFAFSDVRGVQSPGQ